MSVVLRALPRARVAARQAAQVRNVHFDNTPHNCIPGGTSKGSLAVRMVIFSVVGWGLPFFAWKYTEAKAGGN